MLERERMDGRRPRIEKINTIKKAQFLHVSRPQPTIMKKIPRRRRKVPKGLLLWVYDRDLEAIERISAPTKIQNIEMKTILAGATGPSSVSIGCYL
ncbi:MAG: hypothetical protein JXA75_01355 [Candidatus Thermoplasmatota archaeon]|nr:hypothetical protein [Candidatus Thermoplasmatota archaeon]